MEMGSERRKVQGISFPVDGKGARSSTATGKRILAAALDAAGTDTAADAAAKLRDEKNWRFGYRKHVMALAQELADEHTALRIARRALQEANSAFEFHREDKVVQMSELMAGNQFGDCSFHTGIVQGTRPFSEPRSIEVPFQKKAYRDGALVELVESWANTSSRPCDLSFCRSVREAVDHPDWFDLRGDVFVLIGATSEMGPLEHLLAAGATVVAIARKGSAKRNKWKPLLEMAGHSAGKLIFPMDKPQSGQGIDELSQAAGADATRDIPELINWLNGPEMTKHAAGRPLSIYSGIYMDGEAFVRASVAMDAIVAGCIQRQANKPNLLYIDTPSHAHVVSRSVKHDSQRNAKTAFFPYRVLAAAGLLKPNVFVDTASKEHVVFNGLAVEQGPNYAVAKLLQRFRAMVCHSDGHLVSVTNGPPAKTDSVMHSPTMATIMKGIHLFPPNTAMEPETVQALMTIIMVRDLHAQNAVAKNDGCTHVMDLFTDNAWDGGMWRSPYELKSIGTYIFIRHYLLRLGIPLLFAFLVIRIFFM